MLLPLSLNIALKEWNTVCQSLQLGKQIVLLRKGGIHEGKAGFELEHPQFLFFPTFLHQNPSMLKPEPAKNLQTHSAEPEKILLSGAGIVTDIVQLKHRDQMDALDAEHIWTAPLIDMRFNYKPQNPLYLLIVRAYTLKTPVTVDNTLAYAGCKSWVPLGISVDSAATPALSDNEFESRQKRILSHF